MNLPSTVKLVEVGPRDGLQNETAQLSVEDKTHFIELLADSGLTVIEACSFVSAKKIPQMANSQQVMQQLKRKSGVTYSALVPNQQGMQAAIENQITEVAVFAAASETFSQKNIHCSIAESIERFLPVMSMAKQHHIRVRGYISCVLGCPYEGEMASDVVVDVAKQLYESGCYQICLGDTIGTGTPGKTQQLISQVAKQVPIENLAMHFHDTYGQAIANIFASLQSGITTFDSSVSGLGGCPYAKGATGNVATEDVLYLMQGLNIETGIDLAKLNQAGEFIDKVLQRQTESNVARVLRNQSA